MITISELQSYSSIHIKLIAELHKKAFPSFFLTQLGIRFLRALYAGYMEDKDSGIIVAEDGDKIVGFIAYSKEYSKFFKGLIKNHLILFAFCSLGAVIRHPSFFMRLLRAFNKSDSVARNEKYVELASICVDPQIEKRGVGTKLIDYLKKCVDFNIYSYINLETDAENNKPVNDFYLKNGFKLHRQFVTREGRKMNEYRFEGQK